MTEINLYKIDNFQKVFTKLVETIIAQNKKIFCLVENEEEEEELDYLLWSYSQLSFIAHATSKDPFPEEQKLIIGSNISFKLELLLVTSYKKLLTIDINQYEKILLLERYNFTAAKDNLSKLPCNINYFEQDSDGKWIKSF
jgi:DNA polymerase-3 subunit chi